MADSSYTAGKSVSLWIDTTSATAYATAPAEFTVDVAIIGGGIAGLTTGLLLA